MTSRTILGLNELLVVEDDAELLDFQCAQTGILLWPQVRTLFLRMAMSDFLYETPLDGSVSKGVPVSRAIATLTRSIAHNTRESLMGRLRANVCLMSNGVGNQWVEGKLLNRLSDHFARARPGQTLTIEEHFHWVWPRRRHNTRVALHAPLQAWNAIGSKLLVRDAHRRTAFRLIDFVSQRSERLLGWRPGAEREKALVVMLARKLAGMPMQLRGYEAMLKRIRPQAVLILAGCYGPSAALIKAAKARGAVTAEYQHGTISPGHDGYNFAPAMRESAAFRALLPEYFLSYGSWWNDRINAPVSMRTVGNPNRAFRLGGMVAKRSPKDKLLILSDGTEFGIYFDLAKDLTTEAKSRGLTVVLRPHPLERSLLAKKYLTAARDVTIDPNDDLYDSLISAHAVVSELSTGLFEAAGLAEKLFVWNTRKSRFGLPTFPFPSFESASDLMRLLADDRAGRLPSSQVDAIWAPDWEKNYDSFLETCGVQPDASLMACRV